MKQKFKNVPPLGFFMKKPVRNKVDVENVKKIILVASGKGGVGKSTMAVNIACGLSRAGKAVGLIDADILGPSIAMLMGLADAPKPQLSGNKMVPHQNYGVKVMSMGFLIEQGKAAIWRGSMVSKALYQLMLNAAWGHLDYLIIDLPPGTGDVQLSLAENFNIDGSILVSTPQNIALADVKKAYDMFCKLNIPLFGFIENMAYLQNEDGSKNYIFGKDLVEQFAKDVGSKVIATIPIYPDLAKNSDYGKIENSGIIAKKFDDIAQDIINQQGLKIN